MRRLQRRSASPGVLLSPVKEPGFGDLAGRNLIQGLGFVDGHQLAASRCLFAACVCVTMPLCLSRGAERFAFLVICPEIEKNRGGWY
jgi:hypothetical protein